MSDFENALAVCLPMRLHAIACALFYGLAPSWVYEKERHYGCSYWTHLGMNLGLAWRWATWRETAEDRKFEATTNALPYRGSTR